MSPHRRKEKGSLLRIFFRGEALKRFYDTAGMIIGYANSFITITYLSVFNFGLLQLILSMIAIVDGLNIKNLDGPIAVEMRHLFVKGEGGRAKRLFWETAAGKIGLALIVGLIVFVAADVIAGLYGEDIGLLIKIVSPLVILYAVQSVETIFIKSLFSEAHWAFPALREVTKLLLLFGFLIFHELTILTVVIAHMSAEFTAVLVMTFAVVIKKYSKNLAVVMAEGKNLLFNFLKDHGKWVFLGYGFSRVTKSTMPWLIKIFINTEAVAFYTLSLNLVGFIESFIPIVGVDRLLILKMGNEKELAYIFQRSVKYVAWLSLLLLVTSLLVAPPLILLIFPKYTSALPLFRLMLFALPIYGIYKVLKTLMIVLREHKILTMRLMSESLTYAVSSVIFLPALGVLGSGLVYIVTYLERVWFFYKSLIKKYPGFKVKLKNLFKFTDEDHDLIVKIYEKVLSKIKLS